MSEEVVVKVAEFGLPSQLMDELRTVINAGKYDKLTVTELTGVLELIKLEYAVKWINS